MEELAKYGTPALLTPCHKELDISKESEVLAYFERHKPEVVINCAGAAKVDWCELNPQEAFTQNATAVQNLAKACEKYRARLFHMSTDYVFDGLKDGFYVETDQCNPINVYGSSKFFGERYALKHGGTVFRIQWLFGPTKTNYVSWLCAVVNSGATANLSAIQVGSPCSTSWVAQVVLLGIGKNISPGVYHIAHDDYCNRSEVAQLICQHFGKNMSTHFSFLPESYGGAPRPVNNRLSSDKLKRSLGLGTFGSWRDDLSYYLSLHYRHR